MRKIRQLLLGAVIALLPAVGVAGDAAELPLKKWNIGVPAKMGTAEWFEQDSALIIRSKAAGGFCEFFTRAKVPLPSFEVLGVDVRLDRSRTAPLQNFTIRIQDATGEILQYTLAGITLPEGDRLSFTIDRSRKPAVSWGGNNDKKIDLPARICGGAFRLRNGATGTVVLKGISATVKKAAMVAPGIALQLPENRLPVFDPARKSAVLEVSNRNQVPAEAEITVAIRNMVTGRVLPGRTARLKLPAAGTVEFPFDLPEEYGVYELSYSAAFPGKEEAARSGVLRFGCMVPAGRGERAMKGFLVGICSQHLARLKPETAEREIAAIALCGANIVRYCSYWDIMEPKRGEFNFGSLDFVVDTVGKYGLKSQVLHSRLPKWATAADWKPLMRNGRTKAGRALPDFEAWRRSIEVFTSRYRGRVGYAEIWNEPDLYSFADFTTEDYLKLLKTAATAIRANDPAAVILSGGFATVPPPNWTNGNADIVKRTLRDGRNDYDIFAQHNHTTLPQCIAVIDRLMEERRAANDRKPWYMNEAGLTTRNCSEAEQAAEMFRKILYCRARGAMAYNWYALRDDGWNRHDGEHHFGILLPNFEPKPAYVTFNMLTSVYNGAEFQKTVFDDGDGMSLLFRGKDAMLFACFRNRNDRRERYAALYGVTGRVWKIDLFGNSSEVPVNDGVALIETGTAPCTVKVTGREPHFHGELFRFADICLTRGRKNIVRLRLANPSDREQLFRLTLETPDTLKAVRREQTCKAAPHSVVELQWELTPAAGHAAADNGKLRAALGTFGEFAVDLPFEYVNQLSYGDFPEKPDYTVSDQQQVSIQVPSAHEFSAMVWSGPQDCSAKLFLAGDGKNLRLRADVTDDRHVQKNRKGNLWMGDSIQFVIAPTELKGHWRFGFSLRDDGSVDAHIWDVPNGYDAEQALAVTKAEVSRDEAAKLTRYEITMPLRMLDIGTKPFRFNLLVNDNDGTIRESFISLAPGLGRNFDVNQYPPLVLKENEK